LALIDQALRAMGVGAGQAVFDPSIVRGLEYYTGTVFEAELLLQTTDEKGQAVRFGSVGGGGRYDDLVARFTGRRSPPPAFPSGFPGWLQPFAPQARISDPRPGARSW